LGGIERVAAPSRRRRRSRPRHCRGAGRASLAGWWRPRPLRAQLLEAVLAVLLHAPELIRKLLIAELQLLDHPGELPDLGFETIDAQNQVARGALREAIAIDRRCALAGPEQTIEEAGRRLVAGLAERRGRAGQHGDHGRKHPERPEMQAGHAVMI